ncbi:universal stress protein [Haloarcula sp. JP-L23]|uniref:universal stress protein n=1 Tax=Haloarcula sp. JP-L23 TaxID=2716717 RepID=UPI00140EEE0B|nr:universal stress protein [Haloarcula sp. JP-L23]
MYDQILFPTDGSEPAASVLDYALQIAAEHEATIYVLNVVDTSQDSRSGMQDDVDDVLEQEGTEIANEAAQRATERGITVVSEVLHGDPYEAIVEYSTQSGIELIVIPTHGRRGLQRFLLGSVTERAINTADVPVIAVNPGIQPLAYPCQDLLVPTDGSRGSELAVSEGIALANATGATLHLLHVVETGGLGPDARSLLKEEELTTQADEIIADAIETAEAATVDRIESEIEFGVPSKEIRNYIEVHEIDVAILGTHGKTDFSRYMMGGVSAKIVRTSPVPVMWVREPDSSGG